MNASVRIDSGSLYLEAEVYSRYFQGIETAVLTRDSKTLLLFPIQHAAAGGLLLKVLNAQGDRVVHAPEALSACGVPIECSGRFPASWDTSAAALRISLTHPVSHEPTSDHSVRD